VLSLTPAVTAVTPVVLVLILLSALAHDIQQGPAGQEPGSPAPNGHDAQQHVEVHDGGNRGRDPGRPTRQEVSGFVADQRNEPHDNPRMARASKITDGPAEKGTMFQSATKSMGVPPRCASG